MIWAESAQRALDEVIGHIAGDSPDAAVRVPTRVLQRAGSLSTLAERRRVVPEVGDPALRELLVDDYRLLYRVYEGHVVIRAFIHGARDFARWRREEKSKP